MAIDMDIVNAAMVRQRTGGGPCERAGRQRRERQEDRARPGRLPAADDHAAQEPGSVQAARSVAVRRPARAVQLGVGTQGDEHAIAGLTASLRGNQVLDGAAMIGRTVVAPGKRNLARRRRQATNRILPQGMVDVPAGCIVRAARREAIRPAC